MEGVSAAEVEAKVVAHWRSLPPSLAQEDGDGTTNKLLLSFLSALRPVLLAGATAAPGGYGTATSTSWLVSTTSEASGSHEVWVEGVRVLFWWVFVSDGPHACLSFLDAQRGQSEEEREEDAMGQDKADLFCRLGPALLWGRTYAPEWVAILPEDAVPHAVARLCSRLQQASSAAVANVPATSVLLRTLSYIGRLPHARAYSAQKDLVASTLVGMLTHSADPAIPTWMLTFLQRENLLLLYEPILVDTVRKLVDDSRAALSVREAALRLWASTVRDVRDDDRKLFKLATDGSAPPPLRCSALYSLMNELSTDDQAGEARLEVFETALTLAGEEVDERVAIAATETLCHWRVTLDLEMADVRPFIHRVLSLATNAVRKEPDVRTLLDLAADKVVRFHCVDMGGSLPGSLLLSLPLEMHGLLEAKQRALLEKADPKHHTKTLRKVTRTCLLALSELLEHDLYELMRPAIVSMLRTDNRWQLREGGLLVLGCLLKRRGDHEGFGDREAMISLATPALSDPKAKVRKMGCWVVGFLLREPCEAASEAAKLLVRLAVDDPNPGVRRKALLALTDDWTWYAEVVLKECFEILKRDPPLGEAATISVLGTVARGLRHLTVWAKANPLAYHGLYVDVVQACMRTLLDGLSMIIQDPIIDLHVLHTIREASSLPRFADTLDVDHLLACYERHFGALLTISGNREQVNECMIAFREHKLRQPAAKFGRETAAGIVMVAVKYVAKRSNLVLALWALECISEEHPDCVTSLLDAIISALVHLLSESFTQSLVQACHCLDRLVANCGVAMRPYVRTISSALVTSCRPLDMTLRCCLLLVPCGVGDIDDRVLFHLINARPLRTITEPSLEITLRVSTENLASLIVELFAERGLAECSDPKAALAVLTLLADRLQRDRANQHQSVDNSRPLEAVRQRVGQAIGVLAATIGHRALQADQKKWSEFRQGLQWYLPAASPLLALLLGSE